VATERLHFFKLQTNLSRSSSILNKKSSEKCLDAIRVSSGAFGLCLRRILVPSILFFFSLFQQSFFKEPNTSTKYPAEEKMFDRYQHI
jgi:hypothetical protein